MEYNEASLREEFRRLNEIAAKIDVRSRVMKCIHDMENDRKQVRPSPFRWSFALTLAGLFLVILISFGIFFLEDEYGNGKSKGNKEIKINSVEINGKEAKQYYFNSGNEDRVVLWVQKYSEG